MDRREILGLGLACVIAISLLFLIFWRPDKSEKKVLDAMIEPPQSVVPTAAASFFSAPPLLQPR
jgi:hypothetical protein